jgi:teichuronic acid exporter
MSLKRLALKGLFWNVTDKAVNQVGYFFVIVYLAKLLGPNDFGLIGMLSVFILISDSLVNNGFSQALIQRSQHATDDDFSTVFISNLLLSCCIYGILYASAPFIADFYNQPELIDISRILFFVIIFNALNVVARAKLNIVVDFKSQAIANSFATVLGAFTAIWSAVNGMGYWALIFLTLVKSLVNLLICWFYVRWFPSIKFCKHSFRRLFGFGSYLMLAGVVATVVNNLYVMLIGRFFNTASVGYFTQATNVTNFLSQFITATLQGVTYPILTSIKEEKEKLIKIYKLLISVTLIVSLPALLGFCAVSKEFVLLFLGEQWLPAIPVIQLLCIARTITPISAINMSILNAVGRPDLFLKIDLSKLPMTLGALFVAIPFGIEGVAWGMLVTSFVSFFINSYYPGKLFGFGAIEQFKVGWRAVVSAVIMFFTVELVSINVIWLALGVKIVVGIVTYTLLLFVLQDKTLAMILQKNIFKHHQI